MSLSGIFVVGAKRTPFGAFGGSLASLTATQLGTVATRAALATAQVDPETVDAVFFGNVLQSSADAAYLARHVALQSDCAIGTPALTLNRLCGSGFETVLQAAQQIQLKQANVVVAGGTENMSQAPLWMDGLKTRFQGVALGQGLHVTDSLWDGLTDSYAQVPMGQTAENLAQEYQIDREACDAFALRSQQNWAAADQAGVFDAELAPTTVTSKKGDTTVTRDEHPRPDASMESMTKLRPVFNKEGVVTAANASGICDGAGSVIVASEQAVQEQGLQPLCRVVSYAVTGCDPKIMGIGPVEAIKQALQKANLTLGQMDRIEINEAFGAQFLACAKALDLDLDKTNIHGGAIALGHPLGASGSRIVAHLAHAFAQAPSNQYHVGAACIGGGQGIAVILERV